MSRIGQQASDAGFEEGDHVVVVPGWGDGTCRHCQVGNIQLCPTVRFPGFGPHGGFAEFLPVPARYLIKVPRELSFEHLAPLTDAGLTPYRGLKKLLKADALGPDRVLGVFGMGGLGGYAKYAKLLGGGVTISAALNDEAWARCHARTWGLLDARSKIAGFRLLRQPEWIAREASSRCGESLTSRFEPLGHA
ncbi:alcohol dehydrogenase catalytic domain-containing protein [Paraburkholderia unamae]|uniref:Alcohol dehydrogenase catalytic domain-containing protein n=1 Tax=Paraburkholderia unamae TaxID=219649 RepID=A0ACC6RCF0_9BURK